MGLAVAKALAARGGWHLHLLDLNTERGEQAEKEVEGATFHKANVTNYDSLAGIFQKVFDQEGRLVLSPTSGTHVDLLAGCS